MASFNKSSNNQSILRSVLNTPILGYKNKPIEHKTTPKNQDLHKNEQVSNESFVIETFNKNFKNMSPISHITKRYVEQSKFKLIELEKPNIDIKMLSPIIDKNLANLDSDDDSFISRKEVINIQENNKKRQQYKRSTMGAIKSSNLTPEKYKLRNKKFKLKNCGSKSFKSSKRPSQSKAQPNNKPGLTTKELKRETRYFFEEGYLLRNNKTAKKINYENVEKSLKCLYQTRSRIHQSKRSFDLSKAISNAKKKKIKKTNLI